jgi:hypothetical protein
MRIESGSVAPSETPQEESSSLALTLSQDSEAVTARMYSWKAEVSNTCKL